MVQFLLSLTSRSDRASHVLNVDGDISIIHRRRSIITFRRSTQSDDSPAKLASELATARSAYETRKENVIGRAAARVEAINNITTELYVEREALSAILVGA